jgi:uncharacterized RDD family membrane protein YckC
MSRAQGNLQMDAVHDLGNGVYYARNDYAGFLRRLLIILIDILVILMVGIVTQATWDLAGPGVESPIPLLIWFGFAYLYLTLLRGTRLRTLGYILTGVRITNLKGERLSFFWMNLRLVLWILGPINPIVDLIWFWGDEDRQMLRDKVAGTYVIRRRAVPIGGGTIRATTLFVLGLAIVYPEVKKDAPAERA